MEFLTMKNLNPSQRDELIEQYVEIVVDNMDTKSLVQFVTEELANYYDQLSDTELKEQIINTHEEDTYNELINNITETNKNEEYNKLSEITPEREANAADFNTSKVIITPDTLEEESNTEASEDSDTNDNFVEHTSECA